MEIKKHINEKIWDSLKLFTCLQIEQNHSPFQQVS